MDKIFYYKKRFQNTFKKVIVYTSTAMLLTATPALSVSAAETDSQTSTLPAQTPAQQESQPASNTTPDLTPTTETPTPQAPADATTAPPQTPTDATTAPPQTPTDTTATITVTPQPEPAGQNTFEVTPTQSTVYAASQKGLNVRSGPSTEYDKIGKPLKYGQAVTVTGTTNNNWYQIQYSDHVGYVRADLVSSTPLTDTQNPATDNPTAEPPAVENPDAGIADNPPADNPVTEPDSETQTEDSTSEGGYTEVTTSLLGTPVLIILAVAIVGLIALIGYSIYGLFKKETISEEDDYEEPYSDDGYYEEEPYSDDEYYEEEPYSDDEYYEEDGQYSDDEYYKEDDKK